MARIRTVKPDFFRDEDLQDLERANPGKYTMLVFEGLWGHCDKNGNFEWKPRTLKLDILPFLDFDMADTLEVLRDGRKSEMKATLAENTAAKDARRSGEDREDTSPGKYGMTVEPITPDLARQLNLDRDARGVVITGIDPSGAAASAGLRQGDVIEQVNGKAVRSADEVRDALNATGDKPAVLLITRGNATVFVPLRAK